MAAFIFMPLVARLRSWPNASNASPRCTSWKSSAHPKPSGNLRWLIFQPSSPSIPTATHCTRKCLRKVKRSWRSCCKSFVDQFDPMVMASSFEWSIEPGFDDLEGGFDTDHTLPQGDHIGVVVPPGQGGRFEVPAKSATNAFDPIRDDRFAVAGAAEHDPALEVAARDPFSDGPDEKRIIDRRV